MERRLQEFLRKNSHNETTSTLVIHSQRYDAFRELYGHYAGLFMDDPALDELRADYAIARISIRSEERMEKMAQFFFWASLGMRHRAPGSDVTYTHNWPPDDR